EKIIDEKGLDRVLIAKYDGNLWPQDGIQHNRVSHALPDTRHARTCLLSLEMCDNAHSSWNSKCRKEKLIG
ncbi:hypothetical protein ILYODFUR_001460, partial [Ilyodon furcidens]